VKLEEEEALKAEERAKEQEEYDALKSMFVLEDAGAQADEIQQEVSTSVDLDVRS
jgi:hypothetical protein